MIILKRKIEKFEQMTSVIFDPGEPFISINPITIIAYL